MIAIKTRPSIKLREPLLRSIKPRSIKPLISRILYQVLGDTCPLCRPASTDRPLVKKPNKAIKNKIAQTTSLTGSVKRVRMIIKSKLPPDIKVGSPTGRSFALMTSIVKPGARAVNALKKIT